MRWHRHERRSKGAQSSARQLLVKYSAQQQRHAECCCFCLRCALPRKRCRHVVHALCLYRQLLERRWYEDRRCYALTTPSSFHAIWVYVTWYEKRGYHTANDTLSPRLLACPIRAMRVVFAADINHIHIIIIIMLMFFFFKPHVFLFLFFYYIL